MDKETVRNIVLYSRKRGVFYWIMPPKHHQELHGEEAGSIGKEGRVIIQVGDKKYKRAQLAFLYMEGHIPEITDHINNDPTDDRWENLRSATHAQNAMNRKIGKPGRLLPMGIRQLKSGRYCARIGINRKQISLGTFDDLVDAEKAYSQARKKYYGEFA